MPHFRVSATYQNPLVQVVDAKDQEEAVQKAKDNPNGWSKELPDHTDRVNWSFRVDPVVPNADG